MQTKIGGKQRMFMFATKLLVQHLIVIDSH